MRDCNSCGKCCLKYSAGSGLGTATDKDIARWIDRPDILEYIDFTRDLWVSPITGDETSRCPWLRKLPNKNIYKCKIYDVRPDACRAYPVNREQMQRDRCEMLE